MTDSEKNAKLATWLGVPQGKYDFLTNLLAAWKLVEKTRKQSLGLPWLRTSSDFKTELNIVKLCPNLFSLSASEAALAISNAILEAI